MSQIIVFIFSVLSLLGYAGLAFYLMIGFRTDGEKDAFELSQQRTFKLIVYSVMLVHFIYVFNAMKQDNAIDMGLLKMLGLTFWFMLLTTRIFISNHFSPLIFFLIIILNLLVLSVDLLLPLKEAILIDNYAIVFHALSSVIAYSLCGLVILQTIIFSLQERTLKARKQGWWQNLIPSLEHNEKLFYDLSRVAFIGLSISIISGIIVLDDWLLQQVSHKTVFTILAWLIFGFLLFLRKRYILTPQKSARWALGACSLLIIGVFGSKLVLEYIL
jgi:ABC-type uncharacterized transport system permease subunit